MNSNPHHPRRGILGCVFYHNVSAQMPDLSVTITKNRAFVSQNVSGFMFARLARQGKLIWHWSNGPKKHQWLTGERAINPNTGRPLRSAIPYFSEAAIRRFYLQWWKAWGRWVSRQVVAREEFIDAPCFHGEGLTNAEDFRDALLHSIDVRSEFGDRYDAKERIWWKEFNKR